MRLALALGGGGARGFAHIGILKVLADAGIEVSAVAGTSIGSLVGAAYCAGALPALEERARKIRLTDIPGLLSPTMSAKGFFSAKEALNLLHNLVAVETIEELPKQFAAVAADLHTSSSVVFTKGNLRNAVRASIAIPLLMTPIINGPQVLVDGGILDPVPVETARALGADKVIAIDLFGFEPTSPQEVVEEKNREDVFWPTGLVSALSYLAPLSNIFPFPDLISKRYSGTPRHIIDVFEQTLAVSQRELTRLRLQQFPPDLLLQPPVSQIGLLDFHRGEPIIDIGMKVAEAALPNIKRMLEEI